MLQMGEMPIKVGFPFFNKRSFSNSYHTRCDLQGINPTFKDSGFLSASVFRISCRQHHLCRGLVFSSVFEADWPADETRDHFAESQSALLFEFTSSWCNRFYADWRIFFKMAPWSNSSKPSSSWCRGSRVNGGLPAPPGLNFQLPRYTRMSVNSGNPINWRTWFVRYMRESKIFLLICSWCIVV